MRQLRRFLAAGTLMLALAVALWAAIAERSGVKAESAQTNCTTNCTVTAAGAVSVNDALVGLGVFWQSGGPDIIGFAASDNLGTPTTYTDGGANQSAGGNGNGMTVWIATGRAVSAGTPTFKMQENIDPGTNQDFTNMDFIAFTGADTTTLVDSAIVCSAGNSTAPAVSITVNTAGAMVVGYASYNDSSASTFVTNYGTQIFTNNDCNTAQCGSSQYKEESTTGAKSVAWTLGEAKNWTACAVALKPAPGGAPPLRPRTIVWEKQATR